jgi:hypothetical protein
LLPVKIIATMMDFCQGEELIFSEKKSVLENVLNSSFYNEGFSSKHLGECKNI